jgi:membrane-associated phospholipid phosphatase
VHASRRLALSLSLAVLAPAPPLVAQPADTTKISIEPLFTTHDLWWVGGFALGTALSWPFDQSFARRLQRPRNQENRFLQKTATIFRNIGNPGAFIIGGTLYAAGKLSNIEKMADLGFHGTEALIVGAGVSSGIKVFAGRARPYHDVENPRNFALARGFESDDYRSFPSGHSTAGFAAAAAVVSETSRWWPGSTWYVAPVMYGGASLIGISRMYNNKHWASDVMIGAAIGTFAGRKVVQYQHSHPDNRVDRWFLGVSGTPDPGGGWVLRPSMFRR